MKQTISKEEAEKIMKVKGETRGMPIKGKIEFIIQQRGKDALVKFEQTIADLGYPIKYNEIIPNNFYPIGYETLTLLIANKIFDMNDNEIVKMGNFVPRLSAIVRVFMKYFFSMDLMASEAPRLWRRYYTIGDLSVAKLDKKERCVVLRVENYHLHSIHCTFLKGYFETTVQMIVKTDVGCEEIKCVHKGDKCHEFSLKW